jgi:hypothetical protein
MKVFRLALPLLVASAAWSQSTDTPASQATPDQTGPTILSRADMQQPDAVLPENHGGNYVNYFLFARGFYNTGAGNYGSDGSLNGYASSGGFDGGGGINMAHNFEHGLLSLAYSAGYRDYTNGENNSSFYQNLNFSLNYRLNKRWLLALRENIQVLPTGQVAAPLTLGSVGPVGFNSAANRQQFYLSTVSLVYQQTKRLSYEFGGDFFYLAYKPDSYFNSKGFTGTGSVNYRETGRTTIGVGYNYNYFVFSGGIGNSNTNTVFGSFSHLFSQTLQFGISAGGSRTSFSQVVTPVGGGPSFNFERVSYSPFVNAHLVKTKQHYTGTLMFVEGVNAGNGAYATSKSLNAGGGISYAFSRKLATAGNLGYSHLTSIAGPTLSVSGSYGYVYLTGSLTYKLARHFGTNFSATYFGSQSLANAPSNDYVAFYFGLVFTSEDRPVLNF